MLPFSDDDLSQFQSSIRLHRYDKGLTLQLMASRAEGIFVFQDPASANAHINSYNALLSSPLGKLVDQHIGFRKFGLKKVQPHERVVWWFTQPRDFLLFLRTTTAVVSASKSPWPHAFDEACKIEKESRQKATAGFLGRTHLLTSMLVKSPRHVFAEVGRSIARSSASSS